MYLHLSFNCIKIAKISQFAENLLKNNYNYTYLFQIQKNRHVFVLIVSGQRRALPPSARIWIEHIANVMPLARIGTFRIANGAS